MSKTQAPATERPIVLSAPEVRAVLDGRKTQLRRVVKFQSSFSYPHVAYKSVWPHPGGGWVFCDCEKKPGGWEPIEATGFPCPYGRPGDRLWVRETWASDERGRVAYKASEETWPTHTRVTDGTGWVSWRWRSPIHMPRWASRLTLEVTGVRVERLRDITEPDAQAEGCEPAYGSTAREWCEGCPTVKAGRNRVAIAPYGLRYMRLWEEIHGKGTWVKNPFVWVLEFKRLDAAPSHAPRQTGGVQ